MDRDRFERKLRTDVEQNGWHVLNVFAEDGVPPFSYSIGLYQTLGHPEIFIAGLPSRVADPLIHSVGEEIRAGRSFEAGEVNSDLLRGHDCAFRPVPRHAYQEYFGRAIDFYDGENFPVLQLVYPDQEGRWPWDDGAEEGFRLMQPVLAHEQAPEESVPEPVDFTPSARRDAP